MILTSIRANSTTVTGETNVAISQATTAKQITTSTLLVTAIHSLSDKFNISLTLEHMVYTKDLSLDWV